MSDFDNTSPGAAILLSPSSCILKSPVERSSTPLNFENWCGDVELSQGDIDEINLAAFVTAANNSANVDDASNGKRGRDNIDSSAPAPPTVSRRKKKPRGFPKRPLSGYNIFFKQERVAVLQEYNGDGTIAVAPLEGASAERSSVSFQDLGKIIGKRWKALTEEERKKYEYLAQVDSVRYHTDMEIFNETKRMRNEEKNKEAITGFKEEKKEFSPNSWNTAVLSGPPDIKPLFRQTSQPLQTRLPGQPTPAPLRTSAAMPFYAVYAQQPTHPQQQCAQRFQGASATTDLSQDYPIPPGTELVLPDPQGRERKFKVQYKFYTMTRSAAEAYMELLSTSATATPYGFTDHPPPAGSNSRDSHCQYWS